MFEHYSVLLDETIDALNIKEDGIYVDCTLGGGGLPMARRWLAPNSPITTG